MGAVFLSERLQAAARMVTPGNRVCDVGCDHGFASIFLVQQGIAPRALAMDLREGPLRAARAHVAERGLAARIETRLSDGLHNYNIGEAETLLCAGMGGALMGRILAAHPEKTASFRELVLQPQSELAGFRRMLREGGFSILDEEMLSEEGKFYQVIKAAPGAAADLADFELCKLEDKYGPVLLRKKTPVFLSFLAREVEVYRGILAELERQGLAEERRRLRHEEVAALLADNERAQKL